MNLPRPFLNRGNPLRPTLQFLSTSLFSGHSSPFQDSLSPNKSAASSSSSPLPLPIQQAYYDDDIDETDDTMASTPEPASASAFTYSQNRANRTHSRTSSNTSGGTTGIPMIDFSRTPSPSIYPTTQSEEEDDHEFSLLGNDQISTTESSAPMRPLVQRQRGGQNSSGVGRFLFGSWAGWQVYVILIGVWWTAMSLLLGWLNRVILLSGVYKFPYPLAATWIQLFFAHVYLLLFARLSRALGGPLRKAGLAALVAPSISAGQSSSGRILGFSSLNPFNLIRLIFGSGGAGIAGGDIFEFNRSIAVTILPLAITYVGKVLLSNISFAYASFPLFTLCRIGALPLTLILTSFLTRQEHTVATLTSAIVAWLNLLVASIQKRTTGTWETIVSGIFSILFISLFPILLIRIHKKLINAQVSSGELLTTFGSPSRPSESGSKQSTRAYYQILHYTSFISLIILTVLLLVSGELTRIFRNCYFLDVCWFWLICAANGFAAFGVFASTLAFVRATSPLTFVFAGVPRSAIQIVIFGNAKLPVHAWVGVALCWAATLRYIQVRREEGRIWERRRLEGR